MCIRDSLISGELYDKIFPQMTEIVRSVHCHIHKEHIIGSILKENKDKSNTTTHCGTTTSNESNLCNMISNLHHYHLFGYDFMVTSDYKVMLLEINANPAIASGTMVDVPNEIYHQLMLDVLKLVVLPITNGEIKETGNFFSCPGS